MTTRVVGLVVYTLVSLALLAALILFVANFRLGGTYTLTARFDDIGGVTAGTLVKVAGIEVGKVTAVEIDGEKAVATLEVGNTVKLPVDTVASVRWRNLLGQRFLYLDPHAGDAEELIGDGDEITRTDPAADLATLMNSLGPIVNALDPESLNTIFDEVSRGLAGNSENLRSAIDDLGTFTDALATRDEQLASLVSNLNTISGTLVRRDTQIRSMLDNLTALTETFAANTDVVDGALVDVSAFAEDLNFVVQANAENLDELIRDLDSLLRMVDSRRQEVTKVLGFMDEGAETAFRPVRYAAAVRRDIVCVDFDLPPCEHPIPAGDPPESNRGAMHTATTLDAILRGGTAR